MTRNDPAFYDAEMGALIHAMDWAKTPIGPMDAWPPALRMMVDFLLMNRFPLLLWWGPDYVSIYNDAYRPILGTKHPLSLGLPVRECWSEIWHILKPLIDAPFTGGPATWMDDILLEINRYGFVEETHFTIAYSPVPDDTAPRGIGGVLATVHETTEKVVGERRVAVLRDLGAGAGEAKTAEEACAISAEIIGEHAKDIPFALIYLIDRDGACARLAGASGVAVGDLAAPEVIDLTDAGRATTVWPLAEVIRSEQPVIVDDLAARIPCVPAGPWSDLPPAAVALPVRSNLKHQLAGVLVAGVSARLCLDELYKSFFDLVASQIATSVANARAYEEERRRAEALAEIDKAKTLFFSNVSHEFRTPLTLMLGPLEEVLANGAGVPTDALERITMAQRNGLRLLKLVNSLLDFSRIEAGRIQASYEPVDLAAFTSDLASNFRAAIERAGLALKIDAPPLPEPVYVDRDMWEKVVLNLLSNAFKFTFAGEIGIEVGVAATGHSATVTIRDTGTGIPAHEMPRLFERFHRVEGAKGRSFEGSGIGLALVQELVKLHGGVIAVDSEFGRGTAFAISLPFGHAHLPGDRVVHRTSTVSVSSRAVAFVEEALHWLPSERPVSAAGATLHTAAALALTGAHAPGETQGRIVLADDNSDMRTYVTRLLEAEGYVVEAVAEGEAALAAVRADAPDLILSDVMMPGLDGFGLLRAVRADPELCGIPIVLVSARAGEQARVEGRDAGADDYLTKPFSARELVARVSANVRLARLRRDAAERLRARTAELQVVLETVPAAVWFTYDPNGERVTGNSFAAEILRLPKDTNLSLSTANVNRPAHFGVFQGGIEVAPAELPLQRAARGTSVGPEEYEFRFNDGTATVALIRAKPLRAPDGAVVGAVAAAADVTALKCADTALRKLNDTLEARVVERTAELAAANRELVHQIEEREHIEGTLRQMQRLEAVGQLTSGVAHDFNNLLMVILGNLERLERQVAKPDEARRLRVMRSAAERGAKLTSQLLAFSRRQRLEPRPIDVNDVVLRMRDLLASTMGGMVRVEVKPQSELWVALIDPTQLDLAILNLAINARDAMPDGGTLVVETANCVIKGEPRRPEHPPAGEYVAISVGDTGTGMTEAVMERVFEPFFTTKDIGKGSGLGLAQVYGFAKQLGGGVEIETMVGRGTSVRLYFPRAQQSALGHGAEAHHTGRRPDGGVVLVVDDDNDVREVIKIGLSDHGYEVLEAGSGGAALEIVARERRIDLIVVDFAMPGMNGAILAHEVSLRRPDLPVLFLTGYAASAELQDVPPWQIIHKPVEADDLASKIAALIARRTDTRGDRGPEVPVTPMSRDTSTVA